MKWAKCNVGATLPESAGLYFSWGNTDGHPAGAGYDFSLENYNASPAASISDDLTIAQDAARANLGGAWRMPTVDNFVELFNTQYTEFVNASGNVITDIDKRTTYNGVVGLLVRSKANGNTLFLPAAGFYNGTTRSGKDSAGDYWSASFFTATIAYRLYFSSGSIDVQATANRYFGFPVRAVQDGTPNRSIIPPTPEEQEETQTEEEPKDKDER